VRFIYHQPNLLGIGRKSKCLTTSGNRALPKDEICQDRYDQVAQTVPSLCYYTQVQDIDLVLPKDFPNLAVLVLGKNLPILCHIQPSLHCLLGFVQPSQAVYLSRDVINEKVAP